LLPEILANSTPAISRAWLLAQELAGAEHCAYLEPQHLFRGLLAEAEGRASLLLTAAGLDLSHCRTHFQSDSKGHDRKQAEKPLSPNSATESALQTARRFAIEFSPDRIIASEHVLLAILRTDQQLRELLTSWSLDFARLENSIFAERAQPLPVDEPLHLADSVDQQATDRVIDAAANRAREALRVLEDYCRFVLNDRGLTEDLKSLRHNITLTLGKTDTDDHLAARDALSDVGTTIAEPSERHRASLEEIVQANFKRLQEALRSLEEYSKLCQPNLGAFFKEARYRSYTLERCIVPAKMRRARLDSAYLYLIVCGASCSGSLEWTVAEALAGGVDIVQLREKEIHDRDLLNRAETLRKLTRQAGALFIINDRPDLARLAGADGVHLGQQDMKVAAARQILGSSSLIGVSTHDINQVKGAAAQGADYIGVGPIFPSSTKQFAELAGPPFAQGAIMQTSLPAFAIGGIEMQNLRQLTSVGITRVAVSRAICHTPDPRSMAQRLRQELVAGSLAATV
jgi:thiamine-phosphate pyrophosphorylase